jgi:tRNA(fMet)-specific endonuclease VapC
MGARYMLDTSAWVQVMRPRPSSVQERYLGLRSSEIVVSPIVLGELHVGWRKSARAAANRAVLEAHLRGLEVAPLDASVAERYGEIRAHLEAAGTPISANDLWIAAHALATACVLVTGNVREFDRVPHLRVEDWTR